jgi:DNA-binding transcriptional regulator LsrR (DeoR family)
MALSDRRSNADQQLLVRVAHRYFIAGRSQLEIGRELGFSRPKVQRLLDRARDSGVVDIRIIGPSAEAAALEFQVRRDFQLDDAIITPSDPDPQAQRRAVARATAEYLERHVPPGGVVAVGMGRNTGELASVFRPAHSLDCTFVSAMGGSPSIDAPTNPNDICRALAERAGGRCESLFAPAFVESRAMRDRLLRQEAVGHTLRIAAEAAIAVVGVGGTDDGCTMVRSGCCPLEEMQRLRAARAVGDILGNYFDAAGELIASSLNDRIVGLTLAQLRRIDRVIVTASESADKASALLGALRTGIPDVLIADETTARLLLDAAHEPSPGDRAVPGEAAKRGAHRIPSQTTSRLEHDRTEDNRHIGSAHADV